jgi:hypothetical protein
MCILPNSGALRTCHRVVVRKKILHHHQLYINRPDPVPFMSVSVDTSDHIYDDFLCLLFLHPHRETSVLPNEIPEVSGQFRFLRSPYLTNIKGLVRLILSKVSDMRISIPIDYRISFVLDTLRHFYLLPSFSSSVFCNDT